jgi:hypothetical protein
MKPLMPMWLIDLAYRMRAFYMLRSSRVKEKRWECRMEVHLRSTTKI